MASSMPTRNSSNTQRATRRCSRWQTSPTSPVLSNIRSQCRIYIGATVSLSAVSPRRIRRQTAWSLRAVSDTTSIAVSASSGQTWMSRSLMGSGRHSSAGCSRTSRAVSAPAGQFGSLSKKNGGCWKKARCGQLSGNTDTQMT